MRADGYSGGKGVRATRFDRRKHRHYQVERPLQRDADERFRTDSGANQAVRQLVRTLVQRAIRERGTLERDSNGVRRLRGLFFEARGQRRQRKHLASVVEALDRGVLARVQQVEPEHRCLGCRCQRASARS